MTTKKRGGLDPSEGAEAAKKENSEKGRKLTPRQTRLLKGIVGGEKSGRQAALKAGYSERSSRHVGELLKTQSMREALAEKLIGIDKIALGLNAGTQAMQTDTFCNVVGSKLKGTEKIELTHVDKIAWTERRKYFELICRLKGLDPGIKVEHEGEIDQHLIVEHIHLGTR